jgi:WD40 repeat protein
VVITVKSLNSIFDIRTLSTTERLRNAKLRENTPGVVRMRKRLLGMLVVILGLLLANVMSNSTMENVKAEPNVNAFVELKTIGDHSAGVNSVAWSPDGMMIASGSVDNTVKVIDYASGAEIWNLTGHGATVWTVYWSPNGSKLVSGASDNIIRIWDYSTGVNENNLTGHTELVKSVAWSPNGTKLASGSVDTHLMIWDYASGNSEKDLVNGPYNISSVAWSPNGTKIATGNENGTIKIWDYATGNNEMNLTNGSSSPIYSVAWSPNSSFLASSHQDGTINIWDYASGMNLTTLIGHSGSVLSLSWSPNGKYLASGSEDTAIKIWNITTGSSDRTLMGHTDFVESVSWSPDGKKIASGSKDNTIRIWGELPDLMLTTPDIWFIYPPQGPTENDTVVIHARIHNNGGGDAFPIPELAVGYWLGTGGGPTNFLGYGNISGVAGGDSAESSFVWTSTTPPGLYTIWIIIDPDDIVIETDEANNIANQSIYIKAYADIVPILVFYVDGLPVTAPVPDSTTVNITVIVSNEGGSNTSNVIVNVYDGDPDAGGILIGTDQIPIINTGASGEVTIEWISTVTGKQEVHSIYAVVSGIPENNIDNNKDSAFLTVNLRPILSVVDISFSDETPMVGGPTEIYASILNSGGTDTMNFFVAFYDGDPASGGTQIGGNQQLSLVVDEIGIVNVSFSSPIRGTHEIFVVADVLDDIDEADETNNIASEVIIVYNPSNDIIVNDANTPTLIDNMGNFFNHSGYTLVEENGELTITHTTFNVLESIDNQYNIVVSDNGTLILKNETTIQTNGSPIKIYLYDNAKLIIEDSIINSTVIEIVAFDNVQIYISNSTVESNINVSTQTADVYFYAINSTLSMPFIHFGGISLAEFYNVYTPSVDLSDNAELRAYKWLKVYVMDGNGGPLMNAAVEVRHFLPPSNQIEGSPKATDSDGLALFSVLTDIITPTTETSFLNYIIDAEFNRSGETHTGSDSVSFTSYIIDKINNIEEVSIYLMDLLPDFYVDMNSVTFWIDGTQRTTVGIGEEVTITATVQNIGTTDSEGVLVRFFIDLNRDGLMDSGELIGESITSAILAEGGIGDASVTWIPTEGDEGDNRWIRITVDPYDTILELNEGDDNRAIIDLDIVTPPDLSFTSDDIRFRNSAGLEVNNVTEGEYVTIHLVIHNLGNNPATDVDVSVFVGFPDLDGDDKPDSPLPPGVELIASENVINIIPGSTTIAFTWDTSGMEGVNDLFIYAIDTTIINGYLIPDQDLTNNNASKMFSVFPKPDLKPIILPPYTENIVMLHDNGTEMTDDPKIGQTVFLRTTIFNDGNVYIPSVNLSLYEGDPDTGGVRIASKGPFSISPQSHVNVSAQWVVSEPIGVRNIFAIVNPDYEVKEHDYSNNKWNRTFNVAPSNIGLFLNDLESEIFGFGETITISGDVKNTDTGDGVTNADIATKLLDDNNEQYENVIHIVFSSSIGTFTLDITAPSEEGYYTILTQVNQNGAIPEDDFTDNNASITINVDDGDGYFGSDDEFPGDPNQWNDSDGDGYGDNPGYENSDEFPNDTKEWLDSDGDGHGDNSDAFPDDPEKWEDSDDDDIGDGSGSFLDLQNNLLYIFLAIVIVVIVILVFLLTKKGKGLQEIPEVEEGLGEGEREEIESSGHEGEEQVEGNEQKSEKEKIEEEIEIPEEEHSYDEAIEIPGEDS